MNIFQNSESSSKLQYDVDYFEQQVDHFNFNPTTPPTFMQRYIISSQYWGTQGWDGCKGPILFYTGNEGDIFMFFNNTGFVTDVLAEQFGGLVVFAEHRYYGESLPFGAESFDLGNVGYLTAEQALADYATLIRYLKAQFNAQDCPVIAFGGSYGGMLTAWFRLKYPNIVDGAIAASAPILQFYGTGVSQWSWNEVYKNEISLKFQVVTNDFNEAGCADDIRTAFTDIIQLGNYQAGLNILSSDFKLCQPLSNANDVDMLVNWIEGAIGFLAMIDYPYPTNFVAPVPAWPVNAFCQQMQLVSTGGGSVIQALAAGVGIFYNYTGVNACYNISNAGTPSLGDQAWEYQTCTEMVMPISSNGTSDMFPLSVFSLESWTEYCQQTWGVTPNPYWVTTNFGGDLLPSGITNLVGSNIVFSNGQLDPWSSGGVVTSPDLLRDMVSIVIPNAAHHLDLRGPNQADYPELLNAREIEIAFIEQWILEKQRKTANN